MRWQATSLVLQRTVFIASMALIVSGCLEGEESTDGFVASEEPTQNSAPAISGSPSTRVTIGATYTFTPNATDPDNDSLTFSVQNKPGWATFSTSTGRLSGEPVASDVGVYSNILISVSDGTHTASITPFAITVEDSVRLSTTLSWTPPTEYEDGAALTDLAGYKIYWKSGPGSYTDSVTIDNPGITSYVVENLAPGTYEFVATAFNASGMESRYSSPATKVLQ